MTSHSRNYFFASVQYKWPFGCEDSALINECLIYKVTSNSIVDSWFLTADISSVTAALPPNLWPYVRTEWLNRIRFTHKNVAVGWQNIIWTNRSFKREELYDRVETKLISVRSKHSGPQSTRCNDNSWHKTSKKRKCNSIESTYLKTAWRVEQIKYTFLKHLSVRVTLTKSAKKIKTEEMTHIIIKD